VLGRFASPDTIVPKPYNPQDWDRYAYVRNNPVKYVDPTGNMAIRDGEVNDKFFVSDYKKYKPTIWLNGYSEYSLPDYSQLQLNDSTGCAPYSMAMAINLALNDNIMTGPGVEYYAEKTFRRVPNLGMPPSLQEAVLQDILLPLNVDYQQGFHELLVNNLKEGNPTVISISWETNVDIVKKLAAKLVGGGEGPIVGHAMVLVGYNPYEKQYKFLDPGSIDKVITSMDVNSFNQIWLEQPNVFIPSGSMVTIRR
jgi:hypothetical protein